MADKIKHQGLSRNRLSGSANIAEKIFADSHHLKFLLRQILFDMPRNRNWLDPSIERTIRDAVKEFSMTELETELETLKRQVGGDEVSETPVNWVGQEDPDGCFVACMAMITCETYAEVKAKTGSCSAGATFLAADDYLSERGYAIARFWEYRPFSYDARYPWPVEPFAPVHACQVGSSGSHWVVMLHDGSILDPATPERSRRLRDYSEVLQVTGIWKVG